MKKRYSEIEKPNCFEESTGIFWHCKKAKPHNDKCMECEERITTELEALGAK